MGRGLKAESAGLVWTYRRRARCWGSPQAASAEEAQAALARDHERAESAIKCAATAGGQIFDD